LDVYIIRQLSARASPAHRPVGSTNEGNVFGLDADTGRPVWDFQTDGICYANPVSFLLDGHQHVAVACGQGLFVFNLL
jgi:alcohol dehydrogenase (cytochrome c)